MLFKGLRKNAIPRGEEGRKIKERFADEDACKQCGTCCHQGFIVCGYFILVPELPCKYLDQNGDGKYYCTTYETRDSVEWCHRCNVKTVKQGLFPEDCSYTRGVINYEGKMLPPKGEEDRIRRALRKRVKYMPRPDYIRASDWAKFMRTIHPPKQKQ